MTKLRKYLAVSLAALLAALMLLSASAADIKVDKSVAVIDNADVLDWETEAYITKVTAALDDACGSQIGVYTVDYIGNTTMEDYCYQVASAWGMGDKNKDNGVVLLFAIGEDDYYVTRGTGIESQLSVASLKRILDRDLEPNWVEGDFNTGARKTVLSIAQEVAGIYGVDLVIDGETYGGVVTQPEQGGWTVESFFGVLIFLLIFAPVILYMLGSIASLFGMTFGLFSGVFGMLFGLFGSGRRRGGYYYGGSHRPGGGYRPGGYGGSSYGSHRSSGSSFRGSGGGSFRSSGGSSFRSSGGSSFRGSGGGSFRGGGAGRH